MTTAFLENPAHPFGTPGGDSGGVPEVGPAGVGPGPFRPSARHAAQNWIHHVRFARLGTLQGIDSKQARRVQVKKNNELKTEKD